MSLSNQDKQRLLAEIRNANVKVLAVSTKLLDKLNITQHLPPAVLSLLHENVNTFYVFHDVYHDIPGKHEYDGLSTVHVYPDTGRRIAGIGLADTVLDVDIEYQTFLVLHELCHLVSGEGEHTELFHAVLDKLIEQTNTFSGFHIENDYCK